MHTPFSRCSVQVIHYLLLLPLPDKHLAVAFRWRSLRMWAKRGLCQALQVFASIEAFQPRILHRLHRVHRLYWLGKYVDTRKARYLCITSYLVQMTNANFGHSQPPLCRRCFLISLLF